jgi:hypothetical protein
MKQEAQVTRKWTVGLIVGALALASLVFGVVQTQADKDAPDLSGTWQLDRSHSDLPGRGGFGGRRNGGEHREGGWRRDGDASGAGGPDGASPGMANAGRGGRRFGMLPSRLQISWSGQGGSHGNVLDFADSAGALVQEIFIGSAVPPEDPATTSDVRRLAGRWVDGALHVERTSPRGGTMVQIYHLEDHGRALEIRSERKDAPKGDSEQSGRRFGPRGPTKLVYRRAA